MRIQISVKWKVELASKNETSSKHIWDVIMWHSSPIILQIKSFTDVILQLQKQVSNQSTNQTNIISKLKTTQINKLSICMEEAGREGKLVTPCMSPCKTKPHLDPSYPLKLEAL